MPMSGLQCNSKSGIFKYWALLLPSVDLILLLDWQLLQFGTFEWGQCHK